MLFFTGHYIIYIDNKIVNRQSAINLLVRINVTYDICLLLQWDVFGFNVYFMVLRKGLLLRI